MTWAMRSCLRAFGEAAGDIGFDKPLGAYSEKEALQVIDAIVTRYTEAMVNLIIGQRHPDTAALRRYLVDDGFMSREAGVYWRSGGSTEL